MRSFLFFLLFLFCFSVFSSEWVENTYDVVKVPDSQAYDGGWNFVCVLPDYSELEVSTTGPYLRVFGSNAQEFGSFFSDSSGKFIGDTLCTWHFGGVGSIATVTVRYKSSNSGSDPDPDPDNPDPDNPDPDNPDPDNPDDSEGAWALESTLQNVKTLISDSNTLTKKISTDLASQLLEVLAISSATSNIQSGVDSMKSDVNSIQSDVNSIQSDVNSMKSDVKSIRTDVGRIKDVLSGGESPSSPSRLDRIDVTSSRWETLKKKLLPSYSFFDSMSGPDSYRFSFIFSYPYAPASSSIAAIIDFPIANDASGSINLGSAVVGAFNNFVTVFRSVLLVLMAWCFLKVVIKTLRQW